jgi:hypothetical protein
MRNAPGTPLFCAKKGVSPDPFPKKLQHWRLPLVAATTPRHGPRGRQMGSIEKRICPVSGPPRHLYAGTTIYDEALTYRNRYRVFGEGVQGEAPFCKNPHGRGRPQRKMRMV